MKRKPTVHEEEDKGDDDDEGIVYSSKKPYESGGRVLNRYKV
jgi:hypothetical protein